MPLSPEELYLQLGNLVAEMPDLANCQVTPEVNRWLGRAVALVGEVLGGAQGIALSVACQNLTGYRAGNAQMIAALVH
jgi:hypothetical protein